MENEVDWAGYRKRITADIAEMKKSLEPLQSGQIVMREREHGEEWRDITSALATWKLIQRSSGALRRLGEKQCELAKKTLRVRNRKTASSQQEPQTKSR